MLVRAIVELRRNDRDGDRKGITRFGSLQSILGRRVEISTTTESLPLHVVVPVDPMLVFPGLSINEDQF